MNMGYIAPVTPYDYIQYANRTVAAARKERRDSGCVNHSNGYISIERSKWVGKLCKGTVS